MSTHFVQGTNKVRMLELFLKRRALDTILLACSNKIQRPPLIIDLVQALIFDFIKQIDLMPDKS